MLRKLLPDTYVIALLSTVALASLLPCRGDVAAMLGVLTHVAIAVLFFLHGAKLSREAVVAGFTHWRLHLTTLSVTFILFPVLGLAARPLLAPWVGGTLYTGVLFLCMLPSTVQSSIAFTAMARGNVAASVCGASASNLLGMFVTPLLVGLFVAQGSGAISTDAIGSILVQLLLPFIAGQAARRWIGGWVRRRAPALKYVDQGSILLVVYTAFSAAVVEGLWSKVDGPALLGLLAISALLLSVVMLSTTFGARALGFSREDEISFVFCGSKKSLATGVPMAKVLFAAPEVGMMVLPLMLFHQLQLMVCAVLAQRYARAETLDAASERA